VRAVEKFVIKHLGIARHPSMAPDELITAPDPQVFVFTEVLSRGPEPPCRGGVASAEDRALGQSCGPVVCGRVGPLGRGVVSVEGGPLGKGRGLWRAGLITGAWSRGRPLGRGVV
jgi:hypothetical protein